MALQGKPMAFINIFVVVVVVFVLIVVVVVDFVVVLSSPGSVGLLEWHVCNAMAFNGIARQVNGLQYEGFDQNYTEWHAWLFPCHVHIS